MWVPTKRHPVDISLDLSVCPNIIRFDIDFANSQGSGTIPCSNMSFLRMRVNKETNRWPVRFQQPRPQGPPPWEAQTWQRPAALPHPTPGSSRDVRISCFIRKSNSNGHCARCALIVGSIFDANQQNKTRLVNLFYYRDVITIAKEKTWAPCARGFRVICFKCHDRSGRGAHLI